ncbi:hypothetical protein GCM10007881_37290 [Mesorhizobium huakuii]|uniref:hypothetical protein n=1 Tax=Mesorhizobium huakuii TaxID=28104 RepID=UPI00235BF8CD|nr:hypothetical protein [Mesorhizobium huakuii]GLQ80210.1 hypothetical protein GCM10007881_37290 [Mesorhizobium huakuii]
MEISYALTLRNQVGFVNQIIALWWGGAAYGGKAALSEIGHAIFKHAHFNAVYVLFNINSKVAVRDVTGKDAAFIRWLEVGSK